MEIRNTDYYNGATKFLTEPPESEYTAFSEEGFSYINQSLGLAIAMQRTSKSNYDITVIMEDGNIVRNTEHSILKAANYVHAIINRARRNKE